MITALCGLFAGFVYNQLAQWRGESDVAQLAVSADGSTVAAAFRNGTIRVWREADGEQLAVFALPGQNCRDLALSRTGDMVAAVMNFPPRLVGGVETVSAIDAWHVQAGRRIGEFPTSTTGWLAFAPSDDTLCWFADSTIREWRPSDGDSPRAVGELTDHWCGQAVFSPNGTRVALASSSGVDNREFPGWRRVGAPQPPRDLSMTLAWSESNRLAVLVPVWTANSKYYELHEIGVLSRGGPGPRTTVFRNRESEFVQFLSDGSLLVFSPEAIEVRKADTLELVDHPACASERLLALELSPRGDVAIAHGDDAVATWDTSTWTRRRTLWRDWITLRFHVFSCSILVWTVVYCLLAVRRARRLCTVCGRANERSAAFLDDEQCEDCRRRRLSADELRRRLPSPFARWWLAIAAMHGVALATTLLAGTRRWYFIRDTWFNIVGALMLLMTLVFFMAFEMKLIRIAFVRCRNERLKSDRRLAERCAKRPGIAEHRGSLATWSEEPSKLVDGFHDAVELCRRRLEEAMGITIPARQRLRFVSFASRSAFDAYVLAHELAASAVMTFDCLYLNAPFCKIVACECDLARFSADSVIALRTCILLRQIESTPGGKWRNWRRQGLAAALAHRDGHGELARLRRSLGPWLASGNAPRSSKLFLGNADRLMRELACADQHEAFANLTHFTNQAWSMVEFLGGRRATPQRKQQFQRYCSAAGHAVVSERLFRRHFRIGWDDALDAWRQDLMQIDAGPPEPPPPRLADGIASLVARFVADETPFRERIAAVRRLGLLGYAAGLAELVDLVRGTNQELRLAAVWALGSISGLLLGPDAEAWDAWRLALECETPSVNF